MYYIAFTIWTLFTKISKSIDFNTSSIDICSTDGVLTFGQSAPMTGLPGLSIYWGIMAAFQEVNINQNGINGLKLNLTALDDGFVPQNTVANIQKFINDSNIFAVIGGTMVDDTAKLVASMLVAEKIPLIGVPAGPPFLRIPFNRYIVNLRASYIDEVAAEIIYFVTVRKFTRISAFYSSAPNQFGVIYRDGIIRALSSYNLYAYGLYPTTGNSTLDVLNLLQNEYLPQVLYILDFVNIVPLTLIAKSFFKDHGLLDVLFVYPSFLNIGAYATYYYSQIGAYGATNFYSAVLVPLPTDVNMSIVQKFNEAINIMPIIPQLYDSLISIEGYIVGQLIIETLRRINENYTRESFLDALYDSGNYNFNGLHCGSYGDETSDEPCNQCFRQVFLATVTPDLITVPVPDSPTLKFSTCGYQPKIWPFLFFGLSIDQTNNNYSSYKIGLSIYNGFRAAFKQLNDNGGIWGLKLGINVSDDQSNITLIKENTLNFINNSTIFALVGYPTPQSSNIAILDSKTYITIKPMIGFNTGTPVSRTPFNKYLISFQTSTLKELASIISYFYEQKGFQHISLAFSNDVYGTYVLDSLISALKAKRLQIFSKCILPIVSFNNESMWYDFTTQTKKLIVDGKTPQGIIIASSSYPIAAQFLVYATNHLSDKITYASTSSVGINDFVSKVLYYRLFYDSFYTNRNLLINDTDSYIIKDSDIIKIQSWLKTLNFFFSHYVPYPPSNITNNITLLTPVQEYLSAIASLDEGINSDFPSLQGYLTGKFITQVLGRVYSDTMTVDEFLQALYENQEFNIKGIQCGPFSLSNQSGCSNCLQNIYFYTINSNIIQAINISRNFLFKDFSPYTFYDMINGITTYNTCEYVPNDNVDFGLYTTRFPMIILSIIGIIYACLINIFLLCYRDHTLIKSGIKFSVLTIIGCIFTYIDILIMWPIPTNTLCQTHELFRVISFTFIYGPLLSKTRRINAIFNNKKLRKIRITDNQVLIQFLLFFIVFSLLWLIWVILSPEIVTEKWTGDGKRYEECTSKIYIIYYLICVLELICLLYGCLLCYRIQGISGKYANFNESKSIGVCIYNSSCLGSLCFLIEFLINDPNDLYLITSIFRICEATTIISVLFILPIKYAIKHTNLTITSDESTQETKLSIQRKQSGKYIVSANVPSQYAVNPTDDAKM